jgi:hypothetical protein
VEVFIVSTLAALVTKLTSFVKYVTSGEYREVVTQLVAWGAGVLVVVVAGAAEGIQDLVVIGETTLEQLNLAAEILSGLALGSGASLVYDAKKAIDNTDSAVEPPLGGGRLDT